MDSPASNEGQSSVPWSLALPLPYRVQAVVGLGLLCWATNLHGLDYMGIDVVGAMDLHVDTTQHATTILPHRTPPNFKQRPTASMLYRATYKVFLIYSAWCLASWALFRSVTNNDPSRADAFGFIPAVSTLCVLMAVISPFSVLEKKERDKFLHALKRCLFSPRKYPIYFSDVICADIATSFAKVLGDVWSSLTMLLPGNSLLATPQVTGWARLLAPTVMSLPYLVRLRQCIVEYMLPTNDSRRPFFNAIKYATSFPVIFLSAAQRPHGDDTEPWLSEQTLFRLWLFSALVNSLYSYWWDLTNDWGLELLKPSSARLHGRPQPPHRLVLPRLHSATPLLDDEEPPHLGGPGSPGVRHSDASKVDSRIHFSYPYGLRPTLLYPLTTYPLLIFINLILRLTWSIKLSSHLHKVDRSMSIFYLEMAEVIRRWMWVFLRVEWEVIKKATHQEEARAFNEGAFSDEDGDFELVQTPDRDREFRGNAQFE